ncbi:hypothetical protein HU200_044672 [Digitaria exilis]|uniref:Uncharacterized protein n=1 Tax=Digitaria exilis TaxID=1010633 RepID=A0A835BCE6_9POAL|nr:hypothetical protein HU200_044672 [Digitaria exilis]
MAPRTFQMITCFNIAVHVPLPAKEAIVALGSVKKKLPAEEAIALGSPKKRPWTREIKRKILASVRRERILPVREKEPCDVDVEKQRTPAQSARPVLKRGILKGPRGDGSPEAAIVGVAVDGVRKRKGLRVRFDLPQEEETIAATAPVNPPLFSKGVLGEPPESFRHSGPEMTAAFLASFVAGDADSATPIDHDDELVSRRKERMEACSRRLSYLRDYCPFQREGDEEEDDGTPETTTTTTAENDHAEAALPRVKTGLPFDCRESEAEFVNAIRSGYLLKDDFVSRHAYERSREQFSCNRIA